MNNDTQMKKYKKYVYHKIKKIKFSKKNGSGGRKWFFIYWQVLDSENFQHTRIF